MSALSASLGDVWDFSHTHTQIYMHAGVVVIGPGWHGEVPVTWAPAPGAARWSYLPCYNLTNTLADTCMRTHILTGSEHPHQSQFWAGARCPFSLSHLNRLIRPYLAFLLTLLSHDCCHRKKCAETQRLTPNVAHSIALFLFSIHSANAIFALFLMCFFPPFFLSAHFFLLLSLICLDGWRPASLTALLCGKHDCHAFRAPAQQGYWGIFK